MHKNKSSTVSDYVSIWIGTRSGLSARGRVSVTIVQYAASYTQSADAVGANELQTD